MIQVRGLKAAGIALLSAASHKGDGIMEIVAHGLWAALVANRVAKWRTRISPAVSDPLMNGAYEN
jgi:hypothetical protein